MAAPMDFVLMQKIKTTPLNLPSWLSVLLQTLALSFDSATPATPSKRKGVKGALRLHGKSSKKQESSEPPSDQQLGEWMQIFLDFLAKHDVVKSVSHPGSKDSIETRLKSLGLGAAEGRFELEFFQGLVEAATAKPLLDTKVWESALTLANTPQAMRYHQSTLDSTHASEDQQSTFNSTPRTSDSSSLRGSAQRRELLKKVLKAELKDSVFKNVKDFVQQIFPGVQSDVVEILEKVRKGTAARPWVKYPVRPDEPAVQAWWHDFLVPTYLSEAKHVYRSCSNHVQMDGSDRNRQMDIFVSRKELVSYDWRNVLVVGELTVSKDRANEKFWQMAEYVREIFKAQPTRFFVHGFIIAGTIMHQFIFDRSGVYGGTPFDVCSDDKQETFINILTSYCTMSEDELGIDTIIDYSKDEGDYHSVSSPQLLGNRQFEKTPLFIRRAILGRGSCCYRTSDGNAVIKFSWADDSKIIGDSESPEYRMSREARLLQIAKERDVQNIPVYISCERISSTSDWRRKVNMVEPASVPGGKDGIMSASIDHALSVQLQSASLSGPSDTQPARGADERDCKHEKTIRFQSRSANRTPPSNSRPTTGHNSTYGSSRPSTSYSTQTNNSTMSKLQTPKTFWLNRTLYAQVTQPAGRPLHEFADLPQFLKAMRDAIKGHQSLYCTGEILHRDVSDGNIIITESSGNAGGFWGMLIDLELSAEVENGNTVRTGLRRMTGTYIYMALEILDYGQNESGASIDHTYRHDLESFFYVLINVCLNVTAEGKWKEKNPLENWFAGNVAEVLTSKRDAIAFGWDVRVLDKFFPHFNDLKPLASRLREILFFEGNAFKTTTPKDPKKLYDPIIQAFEDAICELEEPSGR